jgi:parallel beta-helix repeat protein
MRCRFALVLSSIMVLNACDSGGDDGAATDAAVAMVDAGPILPEGCDHFAEPSDDDQTVVQTLLIEAGAGETVCLSAGTFRFTGEVSISVDGLTVQGAGFDETILDFSAQDLGANGVYVSGDGVTLEDFQVKNAKGDGIRGDQVDGIVFRALKVIWERDESAESGAYGVYPVGSTNVLIERCVVKGASDAGIYVGQSQNILVQNNEVYGNVAGIEIENSTDAEVVENHAHDNTGGILIFTLPELPMKEGQRCLVHQNIIENNNVENFGRAGSVVSQVPGGTGAMILAADATEFTANTVRGNNTTGLMFITYLVDLLGQYEDDAYDIFPERSWIHDNTWENNGAMPMGVIQGFQVMDGPDILGDGCIDEVQSDEMRRNCVAETGADYGILDICGDLTYGPGELSAFDCVGGDVAEIDL